VIAFRGLSTLNALREFKLGPLFFEVTLVT
jgi:hypothetical protein